ncbi:hypothetical protein [Adhaeribacter rhizoryzae]|uniref:Uncharacterized protein n=1 Tax=Adhaeribacter rhizoryzae TaxID=2607907 RepID=A0A5M6D2M7_9BACT|nr:hypothetical protein [Adhaeribacter rhizoryzae]KAA5541256.1 hypothetical protein F0145_20860 [Adhaeribacter rhizoryzae]
MNTLEELRLEAKTRFYHHIISKLNATLQEYNKVAVIAQFQGKFDVPEQVTFTLDGQINHLLSITVSLVNKVPESPYLEELFSNFLKDYMHLVNPELPFHAGVLYLNDHYGSKVSRCVPVTESVSLNYAAVN